MYIITDCDRFRSESVYIVIFAWKYGGVEQVSRSGLLRFALNDFLIAANARHACGLRQPIPIASQRGPEKTMTGSEHPNPARGPGVPEETRLDALQGERQHQDGRHVIGASPRR